jgi:hypothetical protein
MSVLSRHIWSQQMIACAEPSVNATDLQSRSAFRETWDCCGIFCTEPVSWSSAQSADELGSWKLSRPDMLAEEPQVCFHPLVVHEFLVTHVSKQALEYARGVWQHHIRNRCFPILAAAYPGFSYFYQILVFFEFRLRPFDWSMQVGIMELGAGFDKPSNTRYFCSTVSTDAEDTWGSLVQGYDQLWGAAGDGNAAKCQKIVREKRHVGLKS